MTALGATLYGGFFVIAALCLIVTADREDEPTDRRRVPVPVGRSARQR